ncbi:putative periplasmic ligand-binding sensor domain protein [Herbaspirillum sp. CF444]|uniref:CHASE3 domain-containing protein n=1 Tax=Herbaspirillum sp. CF444 TaxID=1144319 RepID=UPI00027283B3|nr:CHASE3 domain-containing protein [Herbaspirillum sp. CF444]EJL90871.1 putative periplasmic ligand-binding sensor domain protein [Herbaspirillum sp. CF444]
MNKHWTFGRKLAFGFSISALFLIIVGAVGYWSTYALIDTSYSVTRSNKVTAQIATYLSNLKDAETGQRGYLLTGDSAYLEPYAAAVKAAPKLLGDLRALTLDRQIQQRRIDQIDTITAAKFTELKRTIDLRKDGHADEALKIVLSNEGKSLMDELRKIVDQMNQDERELLDKRAAEAEATAATAKFTIVGGTLVCLLFVSVTGFMIARSLATQLGAAVGHVQSSSAELQAAATQQASGAKEQAGAMTEISTTISELGVTSRQIAESAQRVAQIAEQTATSARAGENTVDKGQEAISVIRSQIDQVVSHMLDLGRKSQEIGAVLDIVSELAEQTNILAINATIEATGAGDAGKRFAVVAEEIRKLADRVANSTKGIRNQVDDVRGAVNTTVMATESGAKAVDAGARQFTEVASAFKQIAGLVATTTEAAREIELSTKQQATAAEQVRIAVTDVAQATQETETSSAQTQQTASQLAGLSLDLRRMIQPQAI